MKTLHKQVAVTVGRRTGEVDEMIAPLIEELWKAGIDTDMSCQNNRPGIVWIMFPTAADAEGFMSIVAEYEEGRGTLYARMSNLLCPDPDSTTPHWEYAIHVEDFGASYEEGDDGEYEAVHDGIPDLAFSVSIRFPHADLPTILARLRTHNAGQAAGAGEVARGR